MKNISLKFFVIVLFVSNLYAQTAEELIKKVQNKFESISDLSADFTQTSIIPGSKSSVKNTGKLFYQKENKYRIEFKSVEIISDGSTIWNHNKKAKKVIINNADDETNTFSIKNLIVDLPKQSSAILIGNEKINGRENKVISLKPKNKESNFESIKIWCDNNYMVHKVEIVDNNDASMVFELSSVKTNQNISSDKFAFKQPSGTEVIDLR